jgi:hypothetical protein
LKINTPLRWTKTEEIPMRKLMTIAAAGALLAGIAVANAQTPNAPGSTPGAGSPGQDQRGGDMEGSKKTPGSADTRVKDAPPSTSGAATTAPSTSPNAMAPAQKNDSSIHQSAGDRDSRGTPKDSK